MRIRQVKPEFWKDRAMADLSPVARLTYIGLWMLADDAGWLRLDEPEVALELYGWDDRSIREDVVGRALEDLVTAGRVVKFDCGHARIPTLVDHQRFAGETKRVYTIRTQHARCIPQPPADARGDPQPPATFEVRNGDSGGSVRSGQSSARKRDDDDASEFQLRVPRTAIR